MYKISGVLLITLVAITGCSSSPFSKENRFSLKEYEDKFFSECMVSESVVKNSTHDKKIKNCRAVSKALIATSQNGFEKNSAKKVTEICKGKNDFNHCVYSAQEYYYDSSLPGLIKKIYSN